MKYKIKSKKFKYEFGGVAGFIGCVVLLAGILSLGGYAFDYSLDAIAGKDIPWYGDIVGGLFTGEIVIPVALVCWLLKLFLPTPFF